MNDTRRPSVATHGRGRRQVLTTLAAACLGGLPAAAVAAASLPEIIGAARDSVLPVGTFDPLANPRFGFRGSGFVVGNGRLLVTNFHVLPDPSSSPSPQLAVLTRTGPELGQIRRATLVAEDRNRDLALLAVDGEPLRPLSLAPADAVREGMDVALMGFPIGGVLGFSVVTHRGILASITRIALPSPQARSLDPRAISQIREGPFEVYQLDATAYPGNSGGPLVDAATGGVIGVVNMVLVRGTRESALANPTGISYAIPARFVADLLARAPQGRP